MTIKNMETTMTKIEEQSYEEWLEALNSNRGKNCPEKPEKFMDIPLGQYHCPYCAMMLIAGLVHGEPSFFNPDNVLFLISSKKDKTLHELRYIEEQTKIEDEWMKGLECLANSGDIPYSDD